MHEKLQATFSIVCCGCPLGICDRADAPFIRCAWPYEAALINHRTPPPCQHSLNSARFRICVYTSCTAVLHTPLFSPLNWADRLWPRTLLSGSGLSSHAP